eukprot:SAG22_NODE_1778_length_3602_cov_1.737083_3_plen_172_part_00
MIDGGVQQQETPPPPLPLSSLCMSPLWPSRLPRLCPTPMLPPRPPPLARPPSLSMDDGGPRAAAPAAGVDGDVQDASSIDSTNAVVTPQSSASGNGGVVSPSAAASAPPPAPPPATSAPARLLLAALSPAILNSHELRQIGHRCAKPERAVLSREENAPGRVAGMDCASES